VISAGLFQTLMQTRSRAHSRSLLIQGHSPSFSPLLRPHQGGRPRFWAEFGGRPGPGGGGGSGWKKVLTGARPCDAAQAWGGHIILPQE
jgi:hypothetical protein